MADEKRIKEANKAYKALCDGIDAIGWTYDRHDNDRIVTFGVNGDDLPMYFVIGVDADTQLIRCISRLPVQFETENVAAGAIACAYATYRIIDGSFDLDITKGEVQFRINASFADSLISPELIRYLVGTACNTIDDYNDGIAAVANGSMTAGEFINKY